MYRNLSIFLFFLSSFGFAQQKILPKDSLIFQHSYRLIKSIDPITVPQMIQKSDSLYQISTNDYQRFYSLFALTNAYQRNNQMQEAYRTIIKADSIAKHSDLDVEAVKSKIYLADFSRNIKDFSLMDKYLNEAETIVKKEHRHPEFYKIKASLLNQRGTYFLAQGVADKALNVFERCYDLIQNDKNYKVKDIEFVLLENIYKTTLAYIQLERWEKANKKLEEGFRVNQKLNHKIYHSAFQSTASWLALKKGEVQKAAEIIIQKYPEDSILGLESHIKTDLMIMSSIENQDSLIDQKELTTKYKNYLVKDFDEKLALSQVIKKKEEEKLLEHLQQTKYGYLGSAFICLVGVGIILYRYYYNQKRKLKLQYQQVIDHLNYQANVKEEEPKLSGSKLPFELSQENVNRILEQLERFEFHHKYTYAKITLGSMADELQTNTKYLSYVLKHYRSSNFPDYINNKRIEYITQRLYHEPDLLKYKIEHIAALAGYSSHSRFTQMFKAQHHISPSDFIRQLKEDVVD